MEEIISRRDIEGNLIKKGDRIFAIYDGDSVEGTIFFDDLRKEWRLKRSDKRYSISLDDLQSPKIL